jgi:hypothetical protein
MWIEKLESWKIGLMTGLFRLFKGTRKLFFPSIPHSIIPIEINQNLNKIFNPFNPKK